jgi:hypothetical protein
MGGCFGTGDKYRSTTSNCEGYAVDYRKVNVDKLIDSWSSGEVLMIKDNLQELCRKRKQKKMTKGMLL